MRGNIGQLSTKPMLSPHKAPLPSTGGTSWGVFVTTKTQHQPQQNQTQPALVRTVIIVNLHGAE